MRWAAAACGCYFLVAWDSHIPSVSRSPFIFFILGQLEIKDTYEQRMQGVAKD
jgi:hypothetical protein